MGDLIPATPNSLQPSPPQAPQQSSTQGVITGGGGSGLFSARRPAMRLTSEFDSEGEMFLQKASFWLFDRLAKLKLSFQHDIKGNVAFPQLAFLTRNFSVLYDLESRNTLLKGCVDIPGGLQLRATHDVKNGQIGKPDNVNISRSGKCLSMSCSCGNNESVVSCMKLGSIFLFKYHHRKGEQGEVTIAATLADPSLKCELTSSVPSFGLPRASAWCPIGEVSIEEKESESEDNKRVLSVSGIVKAHIMNGVCTAAYKDNDLNLRYCYKDEEMTFIPCLSLPSNALSFAFKRRFSPRDKLSYWHHFDSNEWSTVYKHSVSKDLKFKAGYDSEVRLGWASLWIGDEDRKAKTAPGKMKVQFMLQVPQDDIRNSIFMFRVKKRWDF